MYVTYKKWEKERKTTEIKQILVKPFPLHLKPWKYQPSKNQVKQTGWYQMNFMKAMKYVVILEFTQITSGLLMKLWFFFYFIQIGFYFRLI